MKSRIDYGAKRTPAPSVPEHLRRQMEMGLVVPFVGAGISMGADLPEGLKMPSYEALLRYLQEHADADSPSLQRAEREQSQRLIDEGRLMLAADKLDDFFSQTELYRLIRARLNHLQPKPSMTHELLDLLDFPVILTSNYDRILETSLHPTPEVVTYRDAPSIPILLGENKPFVFKIHGDLTRPDTIVLGWKRYRQLHQEKEDQASQALAQFVLTLLMTRTLLFIGCSFRGGEYSEYFSDFANSYRVPPGPHYALVEADSLSEAEQIAWKNKLGVKILEFNPDDDYSQVWEFLASTKPQGAKSGAEAGRPWENFFLLEERPDYLRLQLESEQVARSCRYITPSLTNALAEESYIRSHCDRKLARFRHLVEDFQSFEARTLDLMLLRAKSLVDLVKTGRTEVRALFLQDSIGQEISEVGDVAIERFHFVLRLIENYPFALKLRAYPSALSRQDFMKSTYALIFGGATVDITCFYASQATSNKFTAHIVQVNTQPVTERVEHFERLWVSSLSQQETVELLQESL